jgi:hypothetical protein
MFDGRKRIVYRRIPWWKYEKPTPKGARRIGGWMLLIFGAIYGITGLLQNGVSRSVVV